MSKPAKWAQLSRIFYPALDEQWGGTSPERPHQDAQLLGYRCPCIAKSCLNPFALNFLRVLGAQYVRAMKPLVLRSALSPVAHDRRRYRIVDSGDVGKGGIAPPLLNASLRRDILRQAAPCSRKHRYA